MKMKEYLLSLCKVYKGEPQNPHKQEDDEFRWYIWRQEWGIIKRSADPDVKQDYKMENDDQWDEYFKTEIQAAIDLYAGTPHGADPSKYYTRYFEL